MLKKVYDFNGSTSVPYWSINDWRICSFDCLREILRSIVEVISFAVSQSQVLKTSPQSQGQISSLDTLYTDKVSESEQAASNGIRIINRGRKNLRKKLFIMFLFFLFVIRGNHLNLIVLYYNVAEMCQVL